MTKQKQTPLKLFTEAIGIYFSNFSQFFKYMSFPVLGQLCGLLLIFATTYFYVKNMPYLIEKFSSLNNIPVLATIIILLILPGLIVFTKAFWEYLVAYGAINSMFENLKKSGRVYDFDAHTELIKRRAISFIGLWLLVGIFSILAITPPFWIICGIFTVYFVLIFQVFTLEPELSPTGCAKKSFLLIKGHFASTFLLLICSTTLTYIFIPQLFIKILDISGINNILANFILPIVSLIELPNFGPINFTHASICSIIIQSLIAQILIQYTLPLRSILWAEWYNYLSKNEKTNFSKSGTKKRPSENLMEKSHKKYGKKTLDKNIIKRASQKDDNF